MAAPAKFIKNTKTLLFLCMYLRIEREMNLNVTYKWWVHTPILWDVILICDDIDVSLIQYTIYYNIELKEKLSPS